jgi:hypothetical protein
LRENAAGTDGTGLFIYKFFASYRKSQADCSALEAEILETGILKLENFSINLELVRFGELIEDIFSECEFYDKYISDESFQSLIRETLLEMREYNHFKVLLFTMIFFTGVTTIAYCFLKPEVYSLLTNIFS